MKQHKLLHALVLIAVCGLLLSSASAKENLGSKQPPIQIKGVFPKKPKAKWWIESSEVSQPAKKLPPISVPRARTGR